MELLKIYKSFQKHNSIFIPKKKIVFIIEPGKFLFAEFPETTNIYSVKKYIETFLNKNNFDLIYNNQKLSNSLYLAELCYNNPNIKRFFLKVHIKSSNKKSIEQYKQDINKFKNSNKQLNNELLKLKKENDNKEYTNKISEEQFNQMNSIYKKQNNEISELKEKLKQINDDINKISYNEKKKRNHTKFLTENNNFEIKTYNNIFQKSNSIIYSIKGRNNQTTNINNTKSQ